MTKEEKIIEAYKELGLPFSDKYFYNNGWMNIKPTQYSSMYDNVDLLKLSNYVHSIRPKSLQGIENNNGWIKIESEGDLPKDSFNYYCFCSNGSVMTFNDFEYYKKYIIPELKVTHYQPIVKPKPPVY